MKIETKFNVEDSVYFIQYDQIRTGKIIKIEIVVKNDIMLIHYLIGGCWRDEDKIYKTKEDIIKYLK